MAKIDIYKTPIPLISYCLVTSPRELAHAEKIFGLPRVAFCAVGSEAMTQFFDSGVCIFILLAWMRGTIYRLMGY